MIWVDDLRPIWALMRRLGHEPWSLWRAEDHLRDSRWFGYGHDAARLDDIADWGASNWFATAQANSRRRVKKPQMVERPEDMSKQEPATLYDAAAFFSA